MFEILIESKRKPDKGRLWGMGFASLTIHTALIAAAILATVRVGQSDTKPPRETNMIWLYEPPQDPQVQIENLMRRCRLLQLPPGLSIPNDLPRIDLELRFDQTRYSGSGPERGMAKTAVPAEELYLESLVEEQPSLLSAPEPPYPELLKQARIQGRVLIQAIIDTSGRAEPNSVTILESPDAGFAPGSRSWMLRALFRPARVHGRSVRVLIEVPLDYRITGR